MIETEARYRSIIIGLVAASLPFVALAYKFGIKKAIAIFLVVVVTILSAKLAIYLFTRKSKLAKGTAIALQGNLIFLYFIPKSLKEQMRELEENEQKSSKNGINWND